MKKWKNWWYYHKWYVITGFILLGITCNIVGNAPGLWRKSPDFQIAYVGSAAHNDKAVCIELTCREEFEDNLKDILVTFLEGCSFEDN